MKQLLGEASPEETKAVSEWMNEDATNREYYNQLKQIWESSKALASESTVDENKAWRNFQLRIKSPKATRQIGYVSRFSLLKVAASVIVVLGLAIAGYFLISRNVPAEMITQTRQSVLVDTLPDGSMVTLNKESSIAYSSAFKGKTRSIALKGEAFFEVVADNKKPFIITVNDVQVTVVGTSFNVKSDKGVTEVVVESGIVRVTRAGKTVELKAGERSVLSESDSSVIKETVNDKLYNYYRSKTFVCDDTPLWKLVQVLNEAYDAKISIGRAELNDMRLTATFNNESLEKVLEIIHLTFDITVVRKDGQIILQ